MLKKKLIFIQLNELNIEIVKKYSKDYNFKFFNDDFFKKLSFTESEEKYDLLEPWIQWVSIYTGKRAEDHKIFRLGDITKYSGELVFNSIEKLNKSIGIICSMNIKNNFKNPDFFLSDPWTNTISGPGKMIKFISKTISQIVNLNSHKNISLKLYFKAFIVLLLSFRFKNFFLYSKLILNFKKKWNKALLLDLMLHDIHFSLLKKYKTEFSSIFFNAGAHIQHHYFFNSKYYESKKLKNPQWYVKEEDDPIIDSIIFYDQILSEYKKLDNYEIIMATGLSQIPYDREKYYYRLKDHKNFLKLLNISFDKVEPRMTRDFLITFKNNNDKNHATIKLNELNNINKKEIITCDVRENSIFVTLSIKTEIKKKDEIKIDGNNHILIHEHVVFVALKNGMHNQKGYFYSTLDMNIKNITDINKRIINFFE